MEEDLKRPSHISYKEYQKKITKKPNDGIIIFVSAFFILLLLFLGIAKQISPEVDVSIGDENQQAMNDENDMYKSSVDSRLKLLQEEDSSREDHMFADELEEKVVIPDDKKHQENFGNDVFEEKPINLAGTGANPKPQETASPSPQVSQPQQAQSLSAKVVVGYYATKEQAEVAKGIIAESGLGVSPFVRSIGGAYTIQVGSFATRDKAQSVVNDLLRNNYPARIIME